jgi:hypothetical protein
MSLLRKIALTGGLWIVMASASTTSCAGSGDGAQPVVNSLGMKMTPIPAGSFEMGEVEAVPLAKDTPGWVRNGVWDDKPVRRVDPYGRGGSHDRAIPRVPAGIRG